MTREVDSIIAYVYAARIPGIYAGYTTNGKHSVGSYHEREGTKSASGSVGLAVDFDAPNNNPAALLACARLLDAVPSKLVELFHSPLGHSVKYGQKVSWTIADHVTHVHVAVAKGTFLVSNAPPPTKEEAVTLVIQPQGICERNELSGWAFGRKGHVYVFGDAPYLGGWDDNTQSGDRVCVGMVATESGGGYWLVSNHGETFAYGDAKHPGNYNVNAWGAGEILGAVRNEKQPNGGLTLVRDDGKRLNLYALPS